ncbi:Histidine kinase-, DNA gyrase B-, and HSP90-like ATPase [Pedobacter sp. ok626]|uniref:ATP-binding protein n=1 Tax=Pedobacter sp. ok626 TaxID=1761882 RepID=UPI0008816076|nr:ATP-binding protein [Pedobacter sp. ok626]SDL72300.1 Histidine kinase-, DNA gyrase B-, and HSP90-like ATPase [Pedobacter sp. ok626]
MKQTALFADRFLESFAGKGIISDPKIALIELIANAWDASATKVEIQWPLDHGDLFSISDNGHGMTEVQFDKRFRTLSYDRTREQGGYAEVPEDLKAAVGKRPVFGRNGKGRLSGFAFGDFYQVKTWASGEEIHYKVFTDNSNLLAFNKLKQEPADGHGTQVFVQNAKKPTISFEDIKMEVGMRFMVDPHFEVIINNERVTFMDIPDENITEIFAEVEGVGKIPIKIIDVQTTDRTTQLHGIAWHVKNRLVGECTWKGSGNEHLVDGRRIIAKRYIFIVQANCLEAAVVPDWTMFYPNDDKYKKVFEKVQEKIKDFILELNKENRKATFQEIENATRPVLKRMSIISRERWEKFVVAIQEECPSITHADLEKLGILLANLEQANSKFNLISILSSASVDDLDDIHSVLQKWDVNFAKIVLDEVEYRMRLVEKLQSRVISHLTDEVHDLQSLFHRGLWIFGPEYETIEYTSNVGMTKVIQQLFGETVAGTANRPDFAILKDSSVGLYGFPKYDQDGSEVGIDRLTVVELKKPGVQVGSKEVDQAFKYVTELLTKGLLKPYSRVTCFVLGSNLVEYEAERTTKMDGRVIIQPLDYDTVMRRAKSRLLNLFDKVKNAPYLEDTRIQEYLREKEQATLFDVA